MEATSFKDLFFNKEYNALIGKSKEKLWLMILFVGGTLAALGFAIGGYDSLAEKLKDPFTNWISLGVDSDLDREARDLRTSFNTDEELLDKFKLNKIRPFIVETMQVYSERKDEFIDLIANVPIRFRSIEEDESLKSELLKAKNLISPTTIALDSIELDDKVIAKKETLEKLGYNNLEELNRIKVGFTTKSNNQTVVPVYLEVKAIVKDLPDNADFIVSNALMNLLRDTENDNVFIDRGTGYEFSVLVPSDNKETIASLTETTSFALRNETIEIRDAETEQFDYYTEPLTLINMWANKTLPDSIWQEYFLSLDCAGCDRYYDFDVKEGSYDLFRIGYLAFNFNRLDEVEQLKTFIKDKFDFDLDMKNVIAGDNFAKVAILTLVLSVFLFLFSLFSIVSFIINLLRTHISAISRDLGTLKAFGLKDNVITSTYLNIVLKLFLIASAVGFAICVVFQLLVQNLSGRISFKIIDPVVLIAWLVMLAVYFLVSRNTIRKYLDKTPGDLIYNR